MSSLDKTVAPGDPGSKVTKRGFGDFSCSWSTIASEQVDVEPCATYCSIAFDKGLDEFGGQNCGPMTSGVKGYNTRFW